MTQVVFNLFVIIISILVIFVFLFLLPKEYTKCFSKGKNIVRILCFGLAMSIFLLMLCSIDYTGNACISGEMIEIQQIGSFGGFYDRYRIKILDSNGNIWDIESVFPVYGKLSKHLDDFNTGDRVNVYGSTVIHTFFYRIEAIG